MGVVKKAFEHKWYVYIQIILHLCTVSLQSCSPFHLYILNYPMILSADGEDSNKNAWICSNGIRSECPLTVKKLERHIALGLFVCASWFSYQLDTLIIIWDKPWNLVSLLGQSRLPDKLLKTWIDFMSYVPFQYGIFYGQGYSWGHSVFQTHF